jgi:hypothetical protein
MKKNKLKIGILLNSYEVSAWTLDMFENIIDSDYADITLVVINDSTPAKLNRSFISKLKANYGNIGQLFVRKLLDLTYSKIIERHTHIEDAHKQVCSKTILSGVPDIKVKTKRKVWSDYFPDESIGKIDTYDIDIFIRCGFGILRGKILTVAKYGIWSYHHGDNNVNRGGPAGFWESMESWPTTGSILQILTEDLDNGQVLYRSYSSTDNMSIQDNRSNYYWKSLSFMTRKMKELHEIGEKAFFENVMAENRHPVFYSERLYVKPTNFELFKLLTKKIVEKIVTLYNNKFYLEQWILMFHINAEFSSSLWRYKKIIPPKDRFWADPHIIEKDDTYYIFIEELLYETGKGHISVITMDKKGNYTTPVKILDKPYHLSYPLIVEHDNEYYMLPESQANSTVEIYKCTEFPHKWEFQMNLMEDVKAVDATVFFQNGKWWMFTNMVENKGASSWDELYLFYADDLLTTDWTPHPKNPIVSDCKTSRPAGRVFSQNGSLYRPSQNSSGKYGYGFNIFEIITIDENNYEESIVSSVKPNWDKDIVATHTFSREGSLHVIDAMLKRRR